MVGNFNIGYNLPAFKRIFNNINRYFAGQTENRDIKAVRAYAPGIVILIRLRLKINSVFFLKFIYAVKVFRRTVRKG